MSEVFGGPPAEPRTALDQIMQAVRAAPVKPRTVEDIEAELIRVTGWTYRCSCCGGRRMVPTPPVDFEKLAQNPNGEYADGIMTMLRFAYPPSETVNDL